MTTVRISLDGRAYDATIEQDDDGRPTVTVDGRTFLVTERASDPRSPRAQRIALDGGPTIIVDRPDLAHVQVDETTHAFRLEAVTAGAAAGVVGAEGARIMPPMPGKVVSLRVKEGQLVEAGQVLLVLEAMKMQNEVTSPAAGTVTQIGANEGDTVDTSDVLIELGPADANDGAPDKTKEVVA